MVAPGYRQCTRCLMDTTAAGIRFDDQGRCNYCNNFERTLASYRPTDPLERKARLDALVARVRKDGRGKPYDCVVGLSGGVDSAFALYNVKKTGLRPLAVHMDNGWDSELAANNIENLVRRLGVDLHTHVIDWHEYRGLMQAFFDADVLDVELLYDNAMLAVNYRSAAHHGCKWILGGTNMTTEGMEMPANWNWFKIDKKNILALAKRSNLPPLHTFPLFSTLEYVAFQYVRRIRWVPFLDYIEYDKPKAVEILSREVGFRAYPYKHYESIFTRFYQGYILPTKFGIDKRRLHLSTLLMSGQISREEAMRLMEDIPYPSQSKLQEDIDYFLKKMGWTREQLAEYVARPQVPHAHYGTERQRWVVLEKIARKLRIVPTRTTIRSEVEGTPEETRVVKKAASDGNGTHRDAAVRAAASSATD